MLFQLLYSVSDEGLIWQYFLNAIIVIFARSLDIVSTRYVTKELKLETNKLARKIGWKGMILMQIPTVILGALDFYLALFSGYSDEWVVAIHNIYRSRMCGARLHFLVVEKKKGIPEVRYL